MLEIHGIWILNDNGTMLYNQETFSDDSRELEAVLLGGLLITIQKLIGTESDDDLKTHELENTRLYALKDVSNNVNYILKLKKDIEESKVKEFLSQLKRAHDGFSNELGINYLEIHQDGNLKKYQDAIEKTIRSETNKTISYFL